MADYVNGKEMYDELVAYNSKYRESIVNNTELPQVSAKLANCFIQISTRLSNSYNFVNYTYKEEMIGDAIEKCLKKAHCFDPTRSEQCFAYFTQTAWHAFLLRIKKEQKESSVKAKLIRHKMSSEFVAHGADFDTDSGDNSFITFLQENDAYVDYIEQSKTAVKQLTSLKHRNKTPYKKKAEVIEKVKVYETDLSIFE
jgi:hypothetical protein